MLGTIENSWSKIKQLEKHRKQLLKTQRNGGQQIDKMAKHQKHVGLNKEKLEPQGNKTLVNTSKTVGKNNNVGQTNEQF